MNITPSEIAPATENEPAVFWAPQPRQIAALERPENEIYYGGAKGGGKLSPLESLVCTPKGFIKIGDLKTGDTISDPTTGGTTKVIGVFEHPPMPIYRVTFDDKATIEVGEEHLWAYRLTGRQKPGSKESSERVFAKEHLASTPAEGKWDSYRIGDTAEITRLLKSGKKIRIPLTEPVTFTKYWRAYSTTEPYLVGLFLGDGHIASGAITNVDQEIIDYLHDRGYRTSTGDPKDHRATGKHRRSVQHYFYMNGLLKCRAWEKFIPEALLHAGIEDRLGVLQGLLDTDGTVDKRGHASFCSTSRRLAEDVQFIVRSLGGKANIRVRHTKYPHNGELKQGRESYNVEIRHPKTSSLFRLPRKKARCPDKWNGGDELTRQLVKVEYVGEKPARCIKVSSPRGLYVGQDFIVTHNTDAQIMWTAMPCIAKKNGRVAYPTMRVLVVRKEQQYLRHWIDRATQLFGPMGAVPYGQPVEFRFPGGPKILTGHLQDQKAWAKFHGQEFGKIAPDEINQIEREEDYLLLTANLRASPDGLNQVFATGNPGNLGDAWVKRRWIKVTVNGKPVAPSTPFTDPVTGRTRIFIPATVHDNPALLKKDPGYVRWLEGLPESKKRAWLYGDWDAFEGQYFTEFRPHGPFAGEPEWARHVIHSSEYPLQPWWYRWISMDWGYRHPTALYWHTKGDDGRVITYREMVAQQTGSFEIGVAAARRSINDLAGLASGSMTMYLSHEAFGKEDSGNTRAEQIRDGINMVLGNGAAFVMYMNEDELSLRDRGDRDAAMKAFQSRMEEDGIEASITIRKANVSRTDGWDYMHEMLRWRPAAEALAADPAVVAELAKRPNGETLAREYLRNVTATFSAGKEVLPKWRIFGDRCPILIDTLPRMVHDPSRPEDMLKVDGDDPADSVRYGLMANKDIQNEMPKEYWLADRMTKAQEIGITDPTILAQVARHSEKLYERDHDSAEMGFTLPRRGASRHWRN